jgi:hypothetical protein
MCVLVAVNNVLQINVCEIPRTGCFSAGIHTTSQIRNMF